ncbi:TPA: diguanylate cyclase [Vibrio vulnificus]|nr:diguanylate cyclase [Vibrio vulnificus]HAS6065044.1 diguanylate cyclase [Vibrio vulnificus]
MKNTFNLAFLLSSSSFLVCLIFLSLYVVSYEVERFDGQAEHLGNIKNYTIMMGLITESNIIASKGKHINSTLKTTNTKLNTHIYSADSSKLDYYESIALKTMNETSNYFGNLTLNPEKSVFFYRSYTGKKYLMEQEVDGFKVSDENFSEEWCNKQFMCTVYALEDQLQDRVIVSTIHYDEYFKRSIMSISSPVYDDKKEIVGEYVYILYYDLKDHSAELISEQGFKTTLVTYQGYPLSEFAYTKSYVADNKTIFLFSYPLSKLVIDYSYLFFLFLIMFLIYLSLYQQSKTRKQALERMSSEVIKDELTGLYNRKIFNDSLFKDTIEDSKYTVVAIDGDRFKYINDTLGHHMGDEVICLVGKVMKTTFRRSDFLIRTGGDEFLAILPNCDHKKASELVGRLKQHLRTSTLPYKDLTVTVSTGIATRTKGETLQEMMMQADEALYKAKESRR